MLVMLYTFAPLMIMPPAVVIAIVIALPVTPLITAAIVFNDATCRERHDCQEQGAHHKSNDSHGTAPRIDLPIQRSPAYEVPLRPGHPIDARRGQSDLESVDARINTSHSLSAAVPERCAIAELFRAGCFGRSCVTAAIRSSRCPAMPVRP